MNIITHYGTAVADKMKVTNYIGNMYTLCYLAKSYKDDSYVLLGFSVPSKEYPEWEFWVEIGEPDGSATMEKVELTTEEEDYIKSLYDKYTKSKDLQ